MIAFATALKKIWILKRLWEKQELGTEISRKKM